MPFDIDQIRRSGGRELSKSEALFAMRRQAVEEERAYAKLRELSTAVLELKLNYGARHIEGLELDEAANEAPDAAY
jgi:hypothetical protein